MQASAVFSLSYDLAGYRTREQIDNNVTGSTFNKLNELTAQSAGGPMEFTGAVNKWATITLAGKPASVDSNGNWRGTANVSTGANAIPLVATDVNGNTTTKTINITISGGASRTLTYDLDGNMVNDGAGKLYSYDAANRLLTITQGTNVTTFVEDRDAFWENRLLTIKHLRPARTRRIPKTAASCGIRVGRARSG